MATGKKWREADTIKFVELYERAECLWNFKHPGYKHRNARDKAIQHIIEEMNLPDFGVNELKNKIKNIRSTYQQELNKIKRSKQGLGTDILEEYRTNLAWFPIADRFLSGVIHSAKNAQPKTEAEDTTFYQPNQSSLYNLVETEMFGQLNSETENHDEEKFSPFIVNIEHIKEEYDSNNEYATPNVNVRTKKRRHSHLVYDGIDMKSSEENNAHNQNTVETIQIQPDEWYHFGNNISCQLRNLPLERALVCQKKIMDILTTERLDYITSLRTEEKKPTNDE